VTYENKTWLELRTLKVNRVTQFINDTVKALMEVVKRKNGVATITAAATSVVVTHGWGAAPSVEDISITPTLMSSSKAYWITAVGATTFTINVDVVPGAGTATFAWKISRY
jgi:hypothetical protein